MFNQLPASPPKSTNTLPKHSGIVNMAQGYKVKDKYELGPKIGEGMFGKVRAVDTAPDSVGANSNSLVYTAS